MFYYHLTTLIDENLTILLELSEYTLDVLTQAFVQAGDRAIKLYSKEA